MPASGVRVADPTPSSRLFSPVTLALISLLLVQTVVVPFVVTRFEPGSRTVMSEAWRFFAGHQSDDSWAPMAAARRHVLADRTESLYDVIFFRERIKFQYPPTSLLFTGSASAGTLNLVSWAAVWMVAVLSVVLFWRGMGVGAGGPGAGIGVDAAVRTMALVGLVLTFYPLVRGYTLGQIQVWVDAVFAGFMLAWVLRYRFLAGVALGLLCLIKPPFALIVLWAVVRQDRRVAWGALLVVGAGVVASIGAYGLASHLDYPRVLAFIARRGEAFHANQSFNGVLNRLFANGDSTVWNEHAFAPPHLGVYLGTLAAAVTLTVAALVLPWTGGYSGTILDVAVISLTATIVSPIAWEHHYGILLPIFAMIVTPTCLNRRPSAAVPGVTLAVSFVLTGQFLAPIALRYVGPLSSLLQSYVLAGTLLMLATLYWHGSRAGYPRRSSVSGAECAPRIPQAKLDPSIEGGNQEGLWRGSSL